MGNFPMEAYLNTFARKYEQDRQSNITPLTALSSVANTVTGAIAKNNETKAQNKFELMKEGLKKQRLFVKDSSDSPERLPTVEEIGTGYNEVLNSLNNKKGKMRAGENGSSEFLINDKIYVFKPSDDDENVPVYNYDPKKGKMYDLTGKEVTGPIPKNSKIKNIGESGGRFGLLLNDPDYKMLKERQSSKYKLYSDAVQGKNETDPKLAKEDYEQSVRTMTDFIKKNYPDFNEEELSIITTGGVDVPVIGKVGGKDTVVNEQDKKIYDEIENLKAKKTPKETIKKMLLDAGLDSSKYGYK